VEAIRRNLEGTPTCSLRSPPPPFRGRKESASTSPPPERGRSVRVSGPGGGQTTQDQQGDR
jgi:hypothetical protein